MHGEPEKRRDSAPAPRLRDPAPTRRVVVPPPANQNRAPPLVRIARWAILAACLALAAWLLRVFA